MVPVRSCLPALAAVLATSVVWLVPTAPAQAHPPAHAAAVLRPAAESPLVVTIDDLRPAYIPRSGPIRINGSVTNTDDDTWTTVNVYSFVGDTAMTTPEELAAATELEESEYVGERILSAGTSDSIPVLEPGASEQFSLEVPRSEIAATDAGVYWFGVHALGQGPEGRDENADGRSRTFIPLIPPSTRGTVKTAVVVPLRRAIVYAADGSLADPASWSRGLSPGGRLRALVDFGASAGSRPVSWLVDPALPEAVARLTRGNPPRSLAPTVEPPVVEPSGTPTESPTRSPSSGPAPTGESVEVEPDPQEVAAAEAARTWLLRLEEAIGSDEVLALPYGDLDVPSAAAHDPDSYLRARGRAGGVLTPLDVQTTPAVAAPSGYLDAEGLAIVEDDATVLVTDRMFGADPPGVAEVDGHRVIVTSSAAAAGGPPPGDPRTAVAMRQRLLSEAAVRLLGKGRKPLVVVLPQDWVPQAFSGFFTGLDLPWLELTTVADAGDRRGSEVPAIELAYPLDQSERELDAAGFAAADRLREQGLALQSLLSVNDSVGGEVADQSLAGTSYSTRVSRSLAQASLLRSTAWIEERLGSVSIDAPRGVTLSGETGGFSATISNRLDQPVTVSVTAASDQLDIAPVEPVQIAARSRTTIPLSASTRVPGVHNVTLLLTDADGRPLGSVDRLPIRSAQVSGIIWAIMGVGAFLLFGTIAMRLVRRVRGARAAATDP